MPDYGYDYDRPRDQYTTRPRDYNSSYHYSPRAYEHVPRPTSSAYPLYPSSTSSSSYSRRERRRWPPPPSVESEVESLAKEFGNTSLSGHSGDDVVPARGSLEQLPIIEDVGPPPPVPTNKEDRFVIVGKGSDDDEYDTNPREPRRSRFDRVPALNTDIEQPGLYSRREPSPYAFSKPTDTPRKRESGDYFLSPQPMTPSHSSTPRSIPLPEDKKPRLKPERSSGLSPDANSIFEDSETELDEELRKNTRRPARYSFAPGINDHAREDIRSSLQDLKNEAASKQNNVRFSDISGSGLSSKASTPPPAQRPQSSPAQHASSSPKNNSPRNSYVDSDSHWKPATAIPNTTQLKDSSCPPSPPRSPWEKDQQNFSRTGPKPTSRPVSPNFNNAVPSPPQTRDGDRHPTPYSSSDSRVRPEPRVSSSLRHDTLPPPSPVVKVQAPSPARKPKLPYPEDDHADIYIPTVESHSQQQRLPDLDVKRAQSSNRPPSRNSSPTRDSPKSATRPGFRHRYTDSYASGSDSPKAKNRYSTDPYGSGSESESRRKKERVRMETKPCPRKDRTKGYDDWIALQGFNKFTICPDCYKNHIAGTSFERECRPPRNRVGSRSIKCDFGSPWVRMAYLLIFERQERDLELIRELAKIAETEIECPGDEKVARPWYGLTTELDKFVPGLYICSYDVQQIEALFPSLKGIFTMLPQRESPRTPHRCSFGRPSEESAVACLDTLHLIDKKSMRNGSTPDMTPFLKLFASTASTTPPCKRDMVLYDDKWHFIPRLPEFTVCTACYMKHVRPYLKEGYLAREFHSRPTRLPTSVSLEASCQLYSSRMRSIWADADDNNDMDRLARKVRERGREQNRLQAEMKSFQRALDQVKQEAEGPARHFVDPNVPALSSRAHMKNLEYEIARLNREWRKIE